MKTERSNATILLNYGLLSRFSTVAFRTKARTIVCLTELVYGSIFPETMECFSPFSDSDLCWTCYISLFKLKHETWFSIAAVSKFTVVSALLHKGFFFLALQGNAFLDCVISCAILVKFQDKQCPGKQGRRGNWGHHAVSLWIHHTARRWHNTHFGNQRSIDILY